MLYQYGPFLIQDLNTQPEKTCTLQKPSAFWPVINSAWSFHSEEGLDKLCGKVSLAAQ